VSGLKDDLTTWKIYQIFPAGMSDPVRLPSFILENGLAFAQSLGKGDDLILIFPIRHFPSLLPSFNNP